jgi:RNA polymerase sigma-70 factor (ECF subfamily)
VKSGFGPAFFLIHNWRPSGRQFAFAAREIARRPQLFCAPRRCAGFGRFECSNSWENQSHTGRRIPTRPQRMNGFPCYISGSPRFPHRPIWRGKQRPREASFQAIIAGTNPMDEASDEELMLRIAKGEERAFRALVPRYAARAISLARGIVGNDADAEDIVQDAFLRVWVNAPRWRPQAAFRTWFYRIVFNLSLNRRRRAPFLPLEAAGDPPDPAAGAGERIERHESDQMVAAAIAALPGRQRAVIMLTYDEELTNADAAMVLGTSVAGIESLLVRAKRTLREKLGTLLDES